MEQTHPQTPLTTTTIKQSAWEWRKEYYFDWKEARRAIRFFERELKHVKGELAGQHLKLERWQRRLLKRIFGWKNKSDGLRKHRIVWIEVPRKNGKALAIDTPVLTINGWKLHGDLKPGDFVYGLDGQPKKVQAVATAMRGPCYRLTFSDKTAIVAHARHEWDTQRSWFTGRKRGERRKLPLVDTERIANTLRMNSKRDDFVHSIRVNQAINSKEKALPIPPYTLGAWLGDGHTDSAAITSADAEIIEAIRAEGIVTRKLRAKYLYSFSEGKGVNRANCLKVRLRKVGVLGNKHIPSLYFTSSIRQRLELLAGIVDTDGHINKLGACEICLTNQLLAKDVCALIRTLGYKPNLTCSDAKFYGRVISNRYRIQFYPKANLPLRVPRKRNRLSSRKTTRANNKTIISAEFAGERLANCIQVEGGFYLAGDGLTKTHNSFLGSGLALFLLFADRELGAEVVSAAGDTEQAAIVFDTGKEAVESSPTLSSLARAYKRTIVVPRTVSSYKVLSAEAYSKHGKNLSGIIVDEVHVQPNADLIDTLLTSRGSRRQPLCVMLTTAGHSRTTVCWDYHDYATKVRDGVIIDPTFLSCIFAADPDDEWGAEETWRKANPNYGVSVKPEFLRDEYMKARNSSRYENTFKRLYLNLWTEQETRWIQMEHWDDQPPALPDDQLRGLPCFAGLDLSTRQDISALVLVFSIPDGTFQLKPYFFVPEENAAERATRDRVHYLDWIAKGLITATPGNVIDYDYIEQSIFKTHTEYGVQEYAIDPWNAIQLATRVEANGIPVVEGRQGYATMSSPSKEFEALIISRKMRHGNHPVLRWMAANVSIEQDASGNIKPSKKKSTERIDGVVAGVMGLGRALRNAQVQSVYEQRGLFII